MDLQIFSEAGLKNQSSNALRRGIRSLKRMIEQHLEKIENPKKFCPAWESMSEFEKAGEIRH